MCEEIIDPVPVPEPEPPKSKSLWPLLVIPVMLAFLTLAYCSTR